MSLTRNWLDSPLTFTYSICNRIIWLQGHQLALYTKLNQVFVFSWNYAILRVESEIVKPHPKNLVGP